MDMILNREPTERETTFGEIDGECLTLEDAIREIPGAPVEEWKIPHKTAIPAGRYQITLVDSPKFGPDTMTLLDVPGFKYVRIHSGTNVDSTEGCIVVGDEINRADMTIHGGKIRGVLARLKAKVKAVLMDGEEVWIQINNPEGT